MLGGGRVRGACRWARCRFGDAGGGGLLVLRGILRVCLGEGGGKVLAFWRFLDFCGMGIMGLGTDL